MFRERDAREAVELGFGMSTVDFRAELTRICVGPKPTLSDPNRLATQPSMNA